MVEEKIKDPLMQTPLGLHHLHHAKNKTLFNKHKRRKNNDVVAAMYAMYQTGKSLADIAGVYRKTRQAVYDVFRTRGYELRSKPMKGLMVIDGINFTEMKQGYLRGTVKGRRMMAHYYVWEKENGDVPKGSVLYFLDGNIRNIQVDNLGMISKKDMPKVFKKKVDK